MKSKSSIKKTREHKELPFFLKQGVAMYVHWWKIIWGKFFRWGNFLGHAIPYVYNVHELCAMRFSNAKPCLRNRMGQTLKMAQPRGSTRSVGPLELHDTYRSVFTLLALCACMYNCAYHMYVVYIHICNICVFYICCIYMYVMYQGVPGYTQHYSSKSARAHVN